MPKAIELFDKMMKAYLLLWLVATTALFIIGYSFPGQHTMSIAFPLYMIITWMLCAPLGFLGFSFRSYLEQNHHDKWEEITTVPFFGPGYYNGRRMWMFVRSKELSSDRIVDEYKKRHRQVWRVALFVFCCYAILGPYWLLWSSI